MPVQPRVGNGTSMKMFFASLALTGLAAMSAQADEDDIPRIQSNADYDTTVERLVSTIEGAGAKVLGRIDHGGGAQSVGKDIGQSELFIFGNPVVGTPVMEKNRLAALFLPVKILVYEEADGKVWVAYEDIADRLDELDGLDDDDPLLNPVKGALSGMSKAAAGQGG